MAEIIEPIRRPGAKILNGDVACIVDNRKSASISNSMIKAGQRGYEYTMKCIHYIREPIADIQERRGISRHQRLTFIDLIMALFTNSYNSCLCIVTMIIGLLPLLEGLLNLVRFVLDKILEIGESKRIGEKVIKIGIFVGELFIIFVVLSLITTIILMPIANLIEYALYKMWRLANY